MVLRGSSSYCLFVVRSHNVDPIDLQSKRDAVWSIQQQLLRDDAFVIGLLNEDQRDLARSASVSASSELLPSSSNPINGSAANVISGQSRASVDAQGVPASQGIAGSNRWISQGLPATLTLTLQKPAPVAQVSHLTCIHT